VYRIGKDHRQKDAAEHIYELFGISGRTENREIRISDGKKAAGGYQAGGQRHVAEE